MNIDKDAMLAIIAALGAKADQLPAAEENANTYRKWWMEEQEKVTALRKQLRDEGLSPNA